MGWLTNRPRCFDAHAHSGRHAFQGAESGDLPLRRHGAVLSRTGSRGRLASRTVRRRPARLDVVLYEGRIACRRGEKPGMVVIVRVLCNSLRSGVPVTFLHSPSCLPVLAAEKRDAA